MGRLAKEVTSDIKESEDRQKDLDRIRDSGADGADIRNAVSSPSRHLVLIPTRIISHRPIVKRK